MYEEYVDTFYRFSFLVRILVIRDGDIESKTGRNNINVTIKKQERGKSRPTESGFNGKCTKRSQVCFPKANE